MLGDILDLKLLSQLPKQDRPKVSITITDSDKKQKEYKNLQLAEYSEHYMNGLEKIVFSLASNKKDAAEYEWYPLGGNDPGENEVTDISINWKGEKPHLSKLDAKRFLMLLPPTYDREEIAEVSSTLFCETEQAHE